MQKGQGNLLAEAHIKSPPAVGYKDSLSSMTPKSLMHRFFPHECQNLWAEFVHLTWWREISTAGDKEGGGEITRLPVKKTGWKKPRQRRVLQNQLSWMDQSQGDKKQGEREQQG